MAGDSRKDFIVAAIGNHFGYSLSDGAVAHIRDSKEINTFLDDGNCAILSARPELIQGVKLIQVCEGNETLVPSTLIVNNLVNTLCTSIVAVVYYQKSVSSSVINAKR